MSWTRYGTVLIGFTLLSMLYFWAVPKTVEPHIIVGEELCGAVYKVREAAGIHIRPSSLSRRAKVAESGFFVASCVQHGRWHGVRKVENNCLSQNSSATCTIGWIHEEDFEIFAG